jgi:hypothetical protein
MATFDDLRAVALALPGAYEDIHMGGPAFRVRGRKFALWWARGGRTILKLRPEHQILLFEIRPETFQPCRVGRVDWSFVELANLDAEELAALTEEAWGTVAPRRLALAAADRNR